MIYSMRIRHSDGYCRITLKMHAVEDASTAVTIQREIVVFLPGMREHSYDVEQLIRAQVELDLREGSA